MDKQDHVWQCLDDVLVMLAGYGVPTPERTYKLDGGWSLALGDIRRYIDTLRTQLAAATERAEHDAYQYANMPEISEQRGDALNVRVAMLEAEMIIQRKGKTENET